MKFVLICAMDAEADGFRARLENRKDETVGGLKISRGTWYGQDLSVIRCGVGKVNAALCAQTAVLRESPDGVINVGVAGGVGDGIVTGHAVIASDTVQYDFDLTDLGEGEGLYSPCDGALSSALFSAACQVMGARAHSGRIATGDRFVGDGKTAAFLRDHFGALACEMEGGAVAQVCAAAGVPCAVLRTISDNANEHSSVDFPSFLASAVRDTEKIIALFLQQKGEKSADVQ